MYRGAKSCGGPAIFDRVGLLIAGAAHGWDQVVRRGVMWSIEPDFGDVAIGRTSMVMAPLTAPAFSSKLPSTMDAFPPSNSPKTGTGRLNLVYCPSLTASPLGMLLR